MHRPTWWIAAAVIAALATTGSPGAEEHAAVEVVSRPSEQRVDVLIGGKPFTAYLYGTTAKKPVLFPIRTDRGAIVTRGFPLEPRAGEPTDHPHHVGHWFNHGDVNGFDFWGHSDQTPAGNRSKMGTIVHASVTRAAGGPDRGTLAVTANWIVPDGSTLLTEATELVFRGRAGWRAIDRSTTWTATKDLVFGDTKEGSLGIRVAHALDHPSAQSEGGRTPGTAETPSGRYLASDGRTGEAVWGTSGPWMALTGTVDKEAVTVAIFEHPTSQGHPTRWHARGYGLFAANPFGRKGFDPKAEAAPIALPAGRSFTFRHRILIRTGHLTREEAQAEYDRFVAGQS